MLPVKKKFTINKLLEFKKPNYIWLPLRCGNDTDITVIPRVGDQVYKGDVIGNTKGAIKMFIHSSVSGKITGIEHKVYPNGEDVRCLIIENDFKETLTEFKAVNDNIADYDVDEFIDVIKNAGIVGMSGSGDPTYLKFDIDVRIKTLVVNAVECEPYITADYMLIKSKIRDILDGIDAIMEINKIDSCIIAVSKKRLINVIHQYIGTYVKIKTILIDSKYPNGNERTLIYDTLGIKYKSYPIEKNIVVLNVATVYAIFRALKNGFPVMERIITVSGEMVKNPTNILVKIGTPIKDILEEVGVVDGNTVLVTGSPIRGNGLKNADSMVTKEMTALLVLPQIKREETPCIKCGKCIDGCPVRIAPIFIKNAIYNISKLKVLTPNKCISCGHCSYICPARIDLRGTVIEAVLRLEDNDENN